jgi:NAD(P)-dependent dehydrogenase (short-subunit alcohol dehydrogenase family)
MFELTGKVLLITGGGGARVGTGAGIARVLGAQGATVAVNDRFQDAADRTAAAINEAGGRAISLVFDVRDAAAVDAGVARIVDQLGPIDILVNCAGGGALAPFRKMDPDHWRRIVDLNLFGVVNCTRAVLEPMCERGWGRIVTISSSAAFQGGTVGVSAYGAAKAGAVGFTRQLAIEIAPFGVTANCIAPGLVRGEQVSETEADRDTSYQTLPPVGRVGTPEDLGALIAYLASEESAWVTGQTIHINGGAYTT